MIFHRSLIWWLVVVVALSAWARPTSMPHERQRTTIPLTAWTSTIDAGTPVACRLPVRWEDLSCATEVDTVALHSTFRVPAATAHGVDLCLDDAVGRIEVQLDGQTVATFLGNGLPRRVPLNVELDRDYALTLRLSRRLLPAAWARTQCGIGAVRLEALPAVRLEALHPQFSADGSTLTTVVRVAATTARTANLRLELRDERGRMLTQTATTLQVDTAPTESRLTLRVRNPRRWSPEKPVLYTLRATLTGAVSETDILEVPCGIRTVSMTRQALLINDAPVLLRGLRLPGGVPPLTRDTVWETLEEVLTLAKRAGFNAIMADGPALPEAALVLANQLGLLVIGDIPAGEEGAEVSTALDAFGHHPSLIFWHWTTSTLPPPELTTLRPLDLNRPVLVSDGMTTQVFQTLSFGSPITTLDANVTWPPPAAWQAALRQAEGADAPMLVLGVGVSTDATTTGTCQEGRLAYGDDERLLATLRGAVESVRRAQVPLGYFVRLPRTDTRNGLNLPRLFDVACKLNQPTLLALRATPDAAHLFDAAVLNDDGRTGDHRLYQLLRHPDGATTIATRTVILTGERVQPLNNFPALPVPGEYRLHLLLMHEDIVVASAQASVVVPPALQTAREPAAIR